MVIQNISTKKFYDCTKEEYEKFYKGKLNWKLISDEEKPKDQIIENKTKPVINEPSKKESQIKNEKSNTKKSNTNEKI